MIPLITRKIELQIAFFLLTFLSFSFLGGLVAPPQIIDSTPLEDRLFEMGWEKEGARFGFRVSEDIVTLVLSAPDKVWSSLPRHIQGFFSKDGAGCLFTHQTSFNQAHISFRKSPHQIGREIFKKRDRSLFGKPRVIRNSSPIRLTEDDLVSLLAKDKVLFYTGAGLSIASGIPGMRQLEEKLGCKKTLHNAILEWVSMPHRIAEVVYSFRQDCENGIPSPGHKAIHDLSVLTNQQILTENLDWMHEKEGSVPLRISKDVVFDKESLDRIKAIICVGLSQDDKGFLNWIKQEYPSIQLIAISTSPPSYLSSEDGWVKGDVHSVLPGVYQRFETLSYSRDEEETGLSIGHFH